MNVAHQPIDLARPKPNEGKAGYTDEERDGMTQYIQAGLIDTFRCVHPETVRYSWWSYRGRPAPTMWDGASIISSPAKV